MTEHKLTDADESIDECLRLRKCFHVIAGAGAGKTASLVRALETIRDTAGMELRRNGQRVVCLTYTKRAVEVIRKRLRWDDLFIVSTLHSFLWNEISQFPGDIRKALREVMIPALIEAEAKNDDGKSTKKAIAARERKSKLEGEIAALSEVKKFRYLDNVYSDYSNGELGHDDVISVAVILMNSKDILARLIGQKYPYILVDEAQDTHEEIVSSLNKICSPEGLPLVGYFGDPMQQIYDKRAGNFAGPPRSLLIKKNENFRCSPQVVQLLNSFRKDLEQFPAGSNKEKIGSVRVCCIATETPALQRNRYSPEQIDRAASRLDRVVFDWGWQDRKDVKQLFLVRQMIARRLNFTQLHDLFDGPYASRRAKEQFESGEYFAFKPVLDCLFPLIAAFRSCNFRLQIDMLRRQSPAFNPLGINKGKSLADMMRIAETAMKNLSEVWMSGSFRDVLEYSLSSGLIDVSERLSNHLNRNRRSEEYVPEIHGSERQDWLIDSLFAFTMLEIEKYSEFLFENTVYSTQHGVKGEEYDKILVVFDDLGAGWSQYNFSGLLTPITHGRVCTDRQIRLSQNLAYVCFSRALTDLRIVLFSNDPRGAAKELVSRGMFEMSQIDMLL